MGPRLLFGLSDGYDRAYNLKIRRRRPARHPEYSAVAAHRGFLTRYEAVRESVQRRVTNTDAERIVFTGMSAGGALALPAFADIAWDDSNRTLELVSFGAPRVFNRAGAEWIEWIVAHRPADTKVLRVINGNDPVPGVPPRILGFRHLGETLHIGAPRRFFLISQRDHHPGYRDTLRRMLKASGIDPDDFPYTN